MFLLIYLLCENSSSKKLLDSTCRVLALLGLLNVLFTEKVEKHCLRRILNACWCQHVSNYKVWLITESHLSPRLCRKRHLMLCICLARMDESADARGILTAVPQSDWKRPAGRPHTSWLATMKNDLSYHNLSVEDATELALDSPPILLQLSSTHITRVTRH